MVSLDKNQNKNYLENIQDIENVCFLSDDIFCWLYFLLLFESVAVVKGWNKFSEIGYKSVNILMSNMM